MLLNTYRVCRVSRLCRVEFFNPARRQPSIGAGFGRVCRVFRDSLRARAHLFMPHNRDPFECEKYARARRYTLLTLHSRKKTIGINGIPCAGWYLHNLHNLHTLHATPLEPATGLRRAQEPATGLLSAFSSLTSLYPASNALRHAQGGGVARCASTSLNR